MFFCSRCPTRSSTCRRWPIRMPNGALASLAGNVDPHHRVAIADLILVAVGASGRRSSGLCDDRPARRRRPVGDDVPAAHRAANRRADSAPPPGARIVVGGYDPSLAPDAYEACTAVDFLVRGEGELTFRELLRALEARRRSLGASPGSAYPHATASSCTTPAGRSHRSKSGDCACRIARRACWPATRCSAVRSTSSRPRAAAPTTAASARSSRCAAATSTRIRSSACSPTSRDARRRGARAIFLVDDNITLDVGGSSRCAEAIVDSGFNDVDYIVQAMTAPIAEHGARSRR